MTDKEIIEGNKLIGEFMNMVNDAADVWTDKETGNIAILGEYRPHKDWNELMPVVEKIMKLKLKKKGDQLIMKESDHYILPIRNAAADGNKKECFCSVFNFIKWYNTQNKPQ